MSRARKDSFDMPLTSFCKQWYILTTASCKNRRPSTAQPSPKPNVLDVSAPTSSSAWEPPTLACRRLDLQRSALRLVATP